MKPELDLRQPYRMIGAPTGRVTLQNGNVFVGKGIYVGPEPKGSGSMHPLDIEKEARAGGPAKIKEVHKIEVPKERPVPTQKTSWGSVAKTREPKDDVVEVKTPGILDVRKPTLRGRKKKE